MTYRATITRTRFGWSASFTQFVPDSEFPISYDVIGFATTPWRWTKRGIEKACARRIARWEAEDQRRADSYVYPAPVALDGTEGDSHE